MRSKLSDKLARVKAANALIRVIANCGRKFFSQNSDCGEQVENPRVSRLEVDYQGRIWFTDKDTQARIYTAYKCNWRGFSDGGTLRNLVDALCKYIRTGAQVNHDHFGPWPMDVCGGDLWGYGEDMQIVRDAAERLGITAPRSTNTESENTHGDD